MNRSVHIVPDEGDGMPARRPAWLGEHDHLVVRSQQDLGRWLERHARREAGLWVVTWKKRPGLPYVSRWDVLDELLRHGWIDGARRQVDRDRTAQWASPRRHAVWTASYRRRFAELLELGRVREGGLAAAQAAVDAGSWRGREDVDRLEVPADLAAALVRHPSCRAWFDAQAPSYRRNVLRWLAAARREATRRDRIERIAGACIAGQRLRHF